MTTDIHAHRDALAARAQENLQDLIDTLEGKIGILGTLIEFPERSTTEQDRLKAKIRGIEAGLNLAKTAISPTTAAMEMAELLPLVPSDEKSGLEIALQDARLLARLP